MSHTDEDDRTILVSNISSSITAVHLRELFSAVGKILELHHLPSLGQCWIEYARVEGAKAAVFLAGTPLGDKEVQVAIKSQLQQQAAATATAGDSTSGEGDEKKESTPTNEEASSLTSPTNGLSLTIPPNTQPSATPLITPTSVTSLPPAATPFESLVRSNPALAAFIQSQQSPSASTPPSSASSFVIPSATTGVDQPFTTRTIYVGNLGPDASDILLRSFFGAIGPVVATKFSGDASLTSRYAFVEFEKQEHATAALAWDQRLLVDRMVKIGKAHNSITKSTTAPFQLPTAITPTNANTPTNSILMSMIPSLATSSTASSALPKPNVDPSKISAAMEKVRAAQEAIARKLAGLPPLPTPADTPTNAAIVTASNEKPDATITSTTSTSTPPAFEEERKEGPSLPSSSSRPSRSRSRPRSRTRSRSPPRPDYAERQRLKREAEERSRAARYAMAMPGTIPEFDRWGARDRETQRTRDRSPSSRHHRSRHSRSRSRSRSRDRRSRRSRSRSRDRHTHSHSHHRHRDHNRRRQGQGPANGGVPMVWDGYQWHPAVPLAPMITPTNTTTI